MVRLALGESGYYGQFACVQISVRRSLRMENAVRIPDYSMRKEEAGGLESLAAVGAEPGHDAALRDRAAQDRRGGIVAEYLGA